MEKFYALSSFFPREKSKYETQIEKVVKMAQKKDREISSLKQVSYKCGVKEVSISKLADNTFIVSA